MAPSVNVIKAVSKEDKKRTESNPFLIKLEVFTLLQTVDAGF